MERECGGSNNINLALGYIENVVRSDFDDVIWDQSLDNVIKVGAGDDLIYLWKGRYCKVFGGAEKDDYVIFQTNGRAVINDFASREDSFVVVDENGDFVSSEIYAININSDGDLVISLTDGGSLENAGLNQPLAHSITENDGKDYVYIDKNQDLFELHIDNFSYFDRMVDEILNGTSSQKFAITFTDIAIENPNYQSKHFSDFPLTQMPFGHLRQWEINNFITPLFDLRDRLKLKL